MVGYDSGCTAGVASVAPDLNFWILPIREPLRQGWPGDHLLRGNGLVHTEGSRTGTPLAFNKYMNSLEPVSMARSRQGVPDATHSPYFRR